MGFMDSIKNAAGGILGDAISGGLGLLGTSMSNSSRSDLAYYNAAMQKEFAQNSIKWRVEDAKRAGVHPMAALGINASSFTPVQSAISSPDFDFISDMGQRIDRAALAAKDKEEQDQAKVYRDAQNNLALENLGLQNDLLRAEIASMKAVAGTPGAKPAPKVGGDTGNIIPQGYNALDWAKVGDYHVPTLSEAAADRTDDDPWAKRVIQGGSLVEFIDGHPGLQPPWHTLTDTERRKLLSGHYHWVLHPFGFRLDPIPGHEKYIRWTNKDGSVGGKIF